MKIAERLEQQADEIGGDYAAKLLHYIRDNTEKMNLTPIEQLFSLELVHTVLWSRLTDRGRFQYALQYNLCDKGGAKYRVDVALFKPDDDSPAVVVELDGHDFHEKTKEQAAKDKKRERAIVATGVRVLRFTGSEVWRDPYKCVEEAVELFRSVAYPKPETPA
jgi:very-short-patch-repair endonuclease